MRKITSTPAAGLTDYFLDDAINAQDQIYEACGAMAKGLGVPVILSGGVASDLGGGNVSITEGVAYFEGEFRAFPAYSGVYPVYLQPEAQITENRLFNATPAPYYLTNNAEWSTSLPGSGEFITYSFDTESMLNNVQAQLVADNFWEHNWRQVGGVGNIQFTVAAAAVIASSALYYRKDKRGRVYWRGDVNFAGAFVGNRGIYLTLVDFNTYTDYEPVANCFFATIKNAAGVLTTVTSPIEGNTTPQFLQVPESAAACSFYLDSVNYATV